ncbi:hypothetical protein THAOC_03795 [Thalassiosira oceanica]|uniref:Uncharacterized protein n=1 Tax=Thalassiosira oceanica TaxID=159749 RepID=K0TBM0_THAOC|nr:hypothetical protein THAOC_03795 [Thalassiosira oceanica]|eukprot:EJK74519.1 hypothetical protein THAOC_03795 [Thalassiosira oceanica]
MFAGGIKDLLVSEMTRERDELAATVSALESKLALAERAGDVQPRSGRDSLSASYRHWDGFEDAEEIRGDLARARAALERMDERIQGRAGPLKKDCGHDARFNCTCSGDKRAEAEVVAMSTSARLDEMARMKQEGNALFEGGKHEEALALYERSLIYFEYCFDGSAEERRRADELRLQCLLNAAACFLRTGMHPKCVEYCEEALEIDDECAKAWFRKGRAHGLMGKVERARADLTRAVGCCRAGEERELKCIRAELNRIRVTDKP